MMTLMSIGAPQVIIGLLCVLLVGGWAMIVNPPSSWINRKK
jgi:hypothetical protein